MGNNQEIRQRMETYRSTLLVFNWIGAIALIILGIVLTTFDSTLVIGIGIIIGSVVIGIIGHFLINVTLAIPFILLNNGDILETMKNNVVKSSYVVIRSMNLRSMPDLNDTSIIKRLPEGEKLILLEKGETIIVENIEAPWFKVRDENNNIGWCFSGCLKEV